MKTQRLIASSVSLILLFFAGPLSTRSAAPALADAPTELYFSEYIEGSAYSKALEIFNGTGAATNLAAGAYAVQMYFNGSSSPGLTIALTGSVAAGDVYVLAHGSADPAILAQADQTNSAGWFNGNDVVVLRKNGVIIDALGQIGFDPISEWGAGDTSTQDNTLRRKNTICQGDPNATDTFDPALEWDGYPLNTFAGLGSHSVDCSAPPVFLINELDADQTLTDTAEFIELFDGGAGNSSLDGLVLVLYNGNGDVSYAAFDLNGYSTDPNGYFVLCANALNTPGCDLDLTPDTDLIQNGADAAALYSGDIASFPTGTPVSLTNLLDAVVYATDDADDSGLLVLLNPGQPQVNENANGVKDLQSNQRCPDGSGGARNTSAYIQSLPTPGGANDCPIPPVIGECGDPATSIHAIQGSGASSPLSGLQAVVEAVVVGDFQDTASGLGGFFLQEEDAQIDADPSTSEGLFVYDNGLGVDVSPGQVVRALGMATEYYDLTELSGIVTGNLIACPYTGVASPATVTLPVASLGDWERWEGMLVSLPQTLYATDNYNLGRYGEVELSVEGRLYAPTQLAPPGIPALALQDLNNRSRLQLDDGSTVENPLPLPPYLGLDNTLRLGDTLAGLTGVLSYSYGAYEVHPTQAVAFTRVNQRGSPAIPVGVNLKIVTMNLLNYFTTLDTGAAICGPSGGLECRGADTAEEFERQRAKIIAAITHLEPDIAAVLEIENNPSAAIQNLVDGLNAAFGAGAYAYIDTGVIGTDAIKVGLIYKPAAVTPLGAFKILDSTVDPTFLDTKNRPSLAQTFQTPGGKKFTLAVNHFKSKGSDCDDVGDPDTGDGQGNCNLTRTAAANALVNWLATDPTGSADPDFLITGDLNSYALEDPIAAIQAAGFINVAPTFGQTPGAPADYTYVYQGQAGTLDYVLASPSLFAQIPYAFKIPANADEPSALDYNDYNQPGLYNPDFFRYADHDPLMITLSSWEVAQVGDELRIIYEEGGRFSQYAVLHLNDSYFRMISGPDSGWGTSLVLMPAFWSGGVYYHGAPVSVAYQVNHEQLALNLSGAILGLQASIQVTISPPESDRLVAHVSAETSGSVTLDNRPGEAFKPLFLSSMHISDTQWDAGEAFADGASLPIPTQGWLIPPTPPLTASTFGLLGGTSAWKTNAPTLQIEMDLPIQVAGWVTPSLDPNDDNVGLWAASAQVLNAWDYTVTAEKAVWTHELYLPLVIR
jgi:predicted extracellular nuclease